MLDGSNPGSTCVSPREIDAAEYRPLSVPISNHSSLIDRDLSLIEFERRVLEEARDGRNPLLDRVKFLGILGRNLDEFVMVRGNKWIAAPHVQQLSRAMHALLQDAQQLLQRDLVPALAEAGIHVMDYVALTEDERADVDRRFTET